MLRLEAGGWANVGKTNLHEFAYGVTSQNPHFGDVPNPVAPGRVAGGSSGGNAAALALGLAEGALGSDSGGSIRIPAACCAIAGFKPGFGLVPVDGCFPLAPSFDHAGPMADRVGGCVGLMRALAPERDWDPPIDSLDEVEVGVAWTADAEPLIGARVEEAARLLPRRQAVDLPPPTGTTHAFMREIAETHHSLFAARGAEYGANVRTKVERCLAVTDAQASAAQARRAAYRELLAETFGRVDLLLTPTMPTVPPSVGADELERRERMTAFTFPFNVAGAPALAVPCGRAEGGLPASAQLVGPPGADALVLAAGELLERRLRGIR